MKSPRRFSIRPQAFTLIELLVVISIIAILAAMLLPVISRVKVKAQIKQAQTDMFNLKAAISHYDTDYSRLPGPTNVDVSFGFNPGATLNPPGPPTPALPFTVLSNSAVMITLLDENFPPNLNHAKNPQQNNFFEGKRNADTIKPGISTIDWNFRDPWGNPYIISLDLDYDGKTYDAFYRQRKTSQSSDATGYNGLNNSVNATGSTDDFGLPGDVMIWSLGPDGKFYNSAGNPPGPGSALQYENKDNVLSWAPQ